MSLNGSESKFVLSPNALQFYLSALLISPFGLHHVVVTYFNPCSVEHHCSSPIDDQTSNPNESKQLRELYAILGSL